MAILTLNDIIAAHTAGQTLESYFRKALATPTVAGRPVSLWRVGTIPAAGGDGAAGSGTPGSGGTALVNADGSLSKGWLDQDPDNKIVLMFGAYASIAAYLVLVDRLVSVSGITLNSTGNKNIGSAALPRYTDGVNVRAWLEVTTTTSVTAPVVSMNSYTDQDGNTGQAGGSVTFPAAATNNETMVELPLAAGDYGVQACATVNVATAASGGAANFILTKEIARVPIEANGARMLQLYREAMTFQEVFDGASLMLYYVPSSTTAPVFDGFVQGVYG